MMKIWYNDYDENIVGDMKMLMMIIFLKIRECIYEIYDDDAELIML